MSRTIFPALLLLCLCGCLQTEDELTINADGSGRVRIETHSALPSVMLESMTRGDPTALYPPVSAPLAQRLFPGTNFHVTVKQDRSARGRESPLWRRTSKISTCSSPAPTDGPISFRQLSKTAHS